MKRKLNARASSTGLAAGATLLACGASALAQTPAPGSFTAEQVGRGKAVYEQSCAVCHGGRFEGSGEAIKLVDLALTHWGSQSAGAFVTYVAENMPPAGGQRLAIADAAAVTAYILQANGHVAGRTELGTNSRLQIGLAQGSAPAVGAAAAAGPAGRPAGAAVPSGVAADAARLPAVSLPYPQREVANFRPVTEEMLDNPPPGDWLSWRRTRDGQAFSPLKLVNKRNVGRLRLAWSIGVSATQQPTPLVHDGIVYFTNPNGIIQALDGVTGDLIWQYQYKDAKGEDVRGAAPRNLAIFGDNLFLQTTDLAMVAVNARTGKQVWRTPKPFGNSSGPIIAAGVLVAGTNNCQYFKPESCFVVGYDPQTGRELWRTHTIAQPGDPNESSWSDVPLNLRAGGDTWIPGSYDSKLNTYYVGVAQAKPWFAISRRMTPVADAALYTGSTLALDPRTGKMKWWFQHLPGETLDMDVAFERVLVDVDGRPMLFTAGKDGIIWKIDRSTGAYVDLTETVSQNVFSKVDRAAGKLTYRQDILDQKFGQMVSYCPAYYGGHNWPASAYSAGNHALIMPLTQLCGALTPITVDYRNGGGGFGVVGDYRRRVGEMPGTNGQAGRLDAYDVRTLKRLWVHTQRAPFTAGAVATAGGLVFVGDSDRYLKAFDVDTGKVLWQTRLPMAAHGFPITYGAGGRQYVAVFAGQLGSLAAPVATLADVLQPAGGNALYVFEMP